MRCFCPPDRLMPRSATGVSYPSAVEEMKPSACAVTAALRICSALASGAPQAMFSAMVALKSSLFCRTEATFSRRAFCRY